ncbi:MAG: glycosyltransferase family 1 protein [candidate division WOR-3 bacterium]|nr:glycosyltransferase family 4 protein [candidate division WOR-3 bacterium]MDH7518194.1 glycosyltransferase family 1 protein [bacterium]
MKILFNAAFDTKENSGISGFIKSLVPQLAKLCELTILTPDPELFSHYGETIKISERVRVPRNSLLWTFFQLPKLCTSPYDLVFSSIPATPIHKKIPAVATVYDLIPLLSFEREEKKATIYHRKKLLLWIGIQSLRSADGIVTISEKTRQDLVTKFPALNSRALAAIPIAPCVNPVATEAETVPDDLPQPSTDYLLYVGGHAPHKNIPRLIAAFAQIAHRFPTLQMVLVGWGTPPLINRTREAIAAHHLKDRVLILPNTLTPVQLSRLYQRCRLFVYPSLYEGFGLPVLEAMANGAPVVCSNTSSLPEVAGDAALYFNPYSVDDIARTLQQVLTDDNLCASLKVRGLSRTNLFSWENTAKKLHQFFQTVIEKR